MDVRRIIRGELHQCAAVLQAFSQRSSSLQGIEQAARCMADTVLRGGKIISCGNGGSHCDAMHFAEELTGRYRHKRRPLPAMCISDPSHLSCVSNDYGYEAVFARYVEALGRPGDVLLAISTSGASPSILQAARAARKKEMHVVALSGTDGGQLAPLAHILIGVPHEGFSDRIQEVHIKIIHILILLIEELTEKAS